MVASTCLKRDDGLLPCDVHANALRWERQQTGEGRLYRLSQLIWVQGNQSDETFLQVNVPFFATTDYLAKRAFNYFKVCSCISIRANFGNWML
jgi:hypothetical protein